MHSTSDAYDTEALESTLVTACGDSLQIIHRLEIRRLVTSLWYDVEMKKQGKNTALHQSMPRFHH